MRRTLLRNEAFDPAFFGKLQRIAEWGEIWGPVDAGCRFLDLEDPRCSLK